MVKKLVDITEIQEQIDATVKAQVAEMRRMMVPHTCFTCKWFLLNDKPPRNRNCKIPDPDGPKVKGRMCISWALEEDVSKHSRGIC